MSSRVQAKLLVNGGIRCEHFANVSNLYFQVEVASLQSVNFVGFFFDNELLFLLNSFREEFSWVQVLFQ
jgi:hypothetical protein